MSYKTVRKRLYDNLDFLTLLAKAKRPAARERLISLANKNQLEAVFDCIRNTLYSPKVGPLTDTHKRSLRKYKKLLVLLANKKLPVDVKRDVLIQRGGFLPAIIAPILGIAGSLIGDLISKAV